MASAFDSSPPGRRHRIPTPDGVELEVREWGDPEGPPLLFITGVAQSYLSFVRQYTAPALQGFRIVAYDPRGHGLSGKPAEPAAYAGRRWSDEVEAVIGGLRLDRPVVAGWSLGGRILRQYLLDYGDAALGGVVFVSARPVEVPEVIGPGNAILPTVDLGDLGSRIAVATQFLRNCFHKAPDAADFAVMVGYNVLCPWEIRQQIGQWLTPAAVSETALRKVRVPTLVVHGLEDVLVLPGAGEMTARLVPHAQTSWFAGCGHSVFYEAAERFNRELADFVLAAAGRAAEPAGAGEAHRGRG
jgi:pimeloyl-ACP methyl ester carboxylesterase